MLGNELFHFLWPDLAIYNPFLCLADLLSRQSTGGGWCFEFCCTLHLLLLYKIIAIARQQYSRAKESIQVELNQRRLFYVLSYNSHKDYWFQAQASQHSKATLLSGKIWPILQILRHYSATAMDQPKRFICDF